MSTETRLPQADNKMQKIFFFGLLGHLRMVDETGEDQCPREQEDEQLCILALNKRSWLSPEAGGAEINLEKTLKELADRGHEVHVLTGSDGGRPKFERDGKVSFRRVSGDKRFPTPLDLIVSYLVVSVYFYWHLYRVSPDVVYTVYAPLPWPVFTRRPRVTIFHHVAIKSFMKTHPFPQNVLGASAQWLGVLRERHNPTVCVSQSTKESLVSYGHDPETVYEVRNGIDIDQYHVSSDSPEPRILFMGGLEEYKGADRLPEIHQSVVEECEMNVSLDIAGRDGPVREQVVEYCSQNDHAQYHGYVSLETKLELLASAWVLVAPSRIEGWGIVVIEANACGTPAVGSRVKGLKDSIRDGETGLLTDGSDPDTFAADICRILTDDSLRRELGENAREWAEEHSWERSAAELEAVFYAHT